VSAIQSVARVEGVAAEPPRGSHRPQSSSASRLTASYAGFFILSVSST
jgi:hypothetical protein